jgi:ABC-type nitrate/sulfonate/bicarbonate transport system substrate-binding protein
MPTVRLRFKAFDPHELLPHFIARSRGLYEQNELTVVLQDGALGPEDESNNVSFSAACGSALCNRLRGGDQVVVFVTSPRPMFWLSIRNGRTPGDLKDSVIAGYPPGTPPDVFLSILLRRAGLDPVEDLRRQSFRNDLARLEMVKSNHAGAALLSSSLPPRLIEGSNELREVFLGQSISVPTSGLAVNEELLREQPEVVRAMVDSFRRALDLIHEEPEVAKEALEAFGGFHREDTQHVYRRLAPLYSQTGQVEVDSLREIMREVAAELEIRELPELSRLYRFDLVEAR